MRVLLTSDTHIGITKDAALNKMYKAISPDDFDIIIHAGDYCGGKIGWKGVRHTVSMIRRHFPDKPFLSVIGNHDYWHKKNDYFDSEAGILRKDPPVTLTDFNNNYKKICEVFNDNDVHFLDTDGPYVSGNIFFVGHTGWYVNSNPPTNDAYFLPKYFDTGHTNVHQWMYKKVSDQFQVNLDMLNLLLPKDEYKTVVFVSHFPVVKTNNQDEREFSEFNWSESIKDLMQSEYDCRYFLNGHSHSKHNGPLRYESGADYYQPRCNIITIS